MLTTFRRSGSMWIEAESGELLTDDDFAELISKLGDSAKVHVFIPDQDVADIEPDIDALNDAFSDDAEE
jgi:hypothetical protein